MLLAFYDAFKTDVPIMDIFALKIVNGKTLPQKSKQ